MAAVTIRKTGCSQKENRDTTGGWTLEKVINPFTAMLAAPSLRKRQIGVSNVKSLWLVFFFFLCRFA